MGMWVGYQTSIAHGLSLCHNQGTSADIGSFVDDLRTTTHGIDHEYVDIHKNMGNNLIQDLIEMMARISNKGVIVGRRRKHAAELRAHYKKKGVNASIKNAAMHFGLGITGGCRRFMIIIKDRLKKAKARNTKVS